MEQIGRFQITGELGRGAMGVVYRALDPSIGRTVAIKTIRLAEAATDKERRFLRDRLFLEARSAGILSHPGIVTIYDVQEQNDVCYVFMEFVDGPSLDKLISTGQPFDRTLFLDVLKQAAAALDYAHGQGIVHRDIKPGNIMRASSGTVKITDFGIAKFTSQQATNTGLLLGTPSYMAPEQIAGQTITGAADQFALAVIAYQLLAGELPFTAATLPALMFKIVHEEPLPVQRLNATLGASVDAVLKKAMSKDAASRYANCTSFVKALGAACQSRPDWRPMPQGSIEGLDTVADALEASHAALAVPAPPPPAGEEPARSRRTTVRAFAAGFLVVCALAFVVSRLFFPNDRATPLQEAARTIPNAPADDRKPSPVGPPTVQPQPPAPEPVGEAAPQTTAPAPPPEAVPPPSSAPPARLPEQSYTVRVVTSPPGARVIIDGQPRLMCTSPCEMPLPAGRHTLATMLAGFRGQQRIFSLPEEREQIMSLDRAYGTLLIRSVPSGAAILINGVQRREVTPAQLTLPAGRYKVEVVKDGLRKEEQDVEIKDGVVTNIDISWKG